MLRERDCVPATPLRRAAQAPTMANGGNLRSPAGGGGTVEQSVEVRIYDQVYHLEGESDPAHAQELAQYVDERMRAVAEVTGAVDSLRLAVLAALHLADEIFTLRARQQQLETEIRERAQRALARVDRALENSA